MKSKRLMTTSLMILTLTLSSYSTFAQNSKRAMCYSNNLSWKFDRVVLVETSGRASQMTSEEISEMMSGEKLTVKDIKNYLNENMNENETCLDDYIKRRNRIIWALSLSPALMYGKVLAGGVIGATVGATTGLLLLGLPNATGIEPLIGYVAGGGVGLATGGISGVTGTGKLIKELVHANRMIKALGEHHITGKIGPHADKLFQKVSKKMSTELSKQELMDRIVDLDRSGKLCDGTMVQRKKVKRLKHRLASRADIARVLSKD